MTDLASPLLAGFCLIPCGPPSAEGPTPYWAFNLTLEAAADMTRRILERPAASLFAQQLDVYALAILSLEPCGATRVMARVISQVTPDDLNRAFEAMARAERGAVA